MISANFEGHNPYVTLLQCLIVATSEFVVSCAGPATEVGSLATKCFPLSHVKMNTLLKPPSCFL